MATVNQLAASIIGAATRNPEERPEIYRRAAYTFMGLAQDPKNVRHSKRLADIGLQFAHAAHAPRPATMDDFVDLLRETEQAYNETGDDPQGEIARRREIHDERTPAMPGHASIAPESFNKDATLGRSAVIKWQPTADDIIAGIQQSQNVAFWQGVKKEAQAMSIDVSLGFLPTITDPDLIVPASVRPYAEIEFGSDGNRTKFRCDVAQGKRLTVVGNYISVSLGVGAPMLGKPSPQITAGASIGAFAAPSVAPVILTEYVDDLAPSESSELIPIPLKAAVLLPMQSTLTLGETAYLEFLDFGGALVGQTFYVQSANANPAHVPIMGDWAYVRVNNGSAGPFGRNFRLPFQLAV